MAKRRDRPYGRSFERLDDRIDMDVGVVLTGPRGGGKSWRWARMLDDAEQSRRLVVHRISGSATSKSIPLGAFAPLLPAEMPPDPNLAQLLALLASTLTSDCAGAVVLGVDDVDLLDDSSATLVSQLVRSHDAVLIATQRCDAPTPWLESLARMGRVRFEQVHPLDDDQVEALAADVLHGPLGRRLATDVRELGQGNPARVRALVEGARDRGEIVDVNGTWFLAGPLNALPVDQALTSGLQAALDALDDESRRLAEILAMVGRAPYDMIETLGDTQAIEFLERAGLVGIDRDRQRATATLSDPLVAAHLRCTTPFSRRRRIAGAIGEWYRQVGARRFGDSLTVARANLNIGAPTPIRIATRAAAEALSRNDPWSAEAICASSLAQHDHHEHGALQVLLARAYLAQVRPDDALEALDHASANACDAGLRVRIAIQRSRVEAIGFARPAAARDSLVGAQRHAVTDDDRARLDLAAAWVALLGAGPHDALRALESLSTDSIAGLTTDEWATYRLVEASAHVRLGRHDRGLELAEATLERLSGDATVDSTIVDELHMLQIEALVAAGELARARALLTTHVPHAAWDAWRLLSSELLLLSGDVTAALETCRRVRVRFAEVGRTRPRTRLVAHDAVLRAHCGDAPGAAEQLAALRGRPEDSDLRVHAAAVRAAILTGDTQDGRTADRILHLIDRSLEAGEQLLGARLIHDALRLDLRAQVAPALDRLAAREPTGLAGMLVAEARAVLDRDASALEVAAWELHDAGALLLAVESLRHAADLYRTGGDDQRERRVVARIETLLRMCPGAQTGEAARRSSLLTARQHQVAALARSHSNLEIAEQLNISVRTVENHLQAVFSTLGLHSRAELSAVFGAPDPAK